MRQREHSVPNVTTPFGTSNVAKPSSDYKEKYKM